MTDVPRGIKLNQNCVFPLHERLKVLVIEHQHSVLVFHLCVIFILLVLVITVLFSLLLFLSNILHQTREEKN